MSQLQDNLNEILRQKNTYLLPANLRAGVTLLGVEGTYGGTHDTVKLFPSVTAMNADTDKVLGDIAIVLDTTNTVTRKAQEGDRFSQIALPNTIAFTEQPAIVNYLKTVQEYCSIAFYDPDTNKEVDGHFGYAISMYYNNNNNNDEYSMNIELNNATEPNDYTTSTSDIRGMYISNDGLTWTKRNGELQVQSFDLRRNYKFGNPTLLTSNHGSDDWKLLLPFISILCPTVVGLYEYKESYSYTIDSSTHETTYTYTPGYYPLETQLTPITASEVYENKVVMGNNNTIVTGTVTLNQTEINTATTTSNEILNPPHTTLAEVETMFDTSSNSNVSSFVTNYLEEFNDIIYGDTSLITGDMPANSIQELVFVGGTKLDTLVNGDQVPMYGTILKVRTTNLNTLLNLNMVNVEYTDGNTSQSTGGTPEWYTLDTDGDYTYVLNTLILHKYTIDTMTNYNITYFNEMM